MPIFPLNTDGIDIWAQNVNIKRVKITNFDDAIVPKPSRQWNEIAKCTQNITVEDSLVIFSVGLSVGSVPPSEGHSCIQDVTFRNIVMEYPLKGIYIKPNPGDVGDGLISRITYENIVMNKPILWSIYIGPQQ